MATIVNVLAPAEGLTRKFCPNLGFTGLREWERSGIYWQTCSSTDFREKTFAERPGARGPRWLVFRSGCSCPCCISTPIANAFKQTLSMAC